MSQQQGDVLLFQTVDDGDIEVINGVITMSGGLETAVYLSLFGGNEDDDGSDGNVRTWWGNRGEPDTTKHMRSETQNLIMSLPLTSGNLRRLHSAIIRDLSWIREKRIAKEITVNVIALGSDKVKIAIFIDNFYIEFYENWKAHA